MSGSISSLFTALKWLNLGTSVGLYVAWKQQKSRQGVHSSQFRMRDLDDWLDHNSSDWLFPSAHSVPFQPFRTFGFPEFTPVTCLSGVPCQALCIYTFVTWVDFSCVLVYIEGCLPPCLLLWFKLPLWLPQYDSPVFPSLSQPGVQLSPPSLWSLCSLSWGFVSRSSFRCFLVL